MSLEDPRDPYALTKYWVVRGGRHLYSPTSHAGFQAISHRWLSGRKPLHRGITFLDTDRDTNGESLGFEYLVPPLIHEGRFLRFGRGGMLWLTRNRLRGSWVALMAVSFS
jgi:hypothetical protein